MNAFRPGSVCTAPTTQVELAICLRNLPDLDVLSKSDPLVVAYTQPFGSNQWQELGRTEVIYNTLNPDFAKKFNIAYRFEEQQKMRFEVYDVDSNSSDLRQHDFIGWVETTLGYLVSQKVAKKKIDYHNPSMDRGTLIIIAEELSTNKEEVELQVVAHRLDKKKFLFGKSDPFLVLSKSNENGEYVVVHKTEVAKNTLNPVWKAFTVPVRTLNNGDYERTIKLECFHYNSNGSHSLIGHTFFSLQKLITGPLPLALSCINPHKQKRDREAKDSGQIEFVHCKIKPVYTFLDYLQGGTEMNCTIAIDFTASNGDPNTSSSLHYMHGGPTKYELALSAVGEIVEDYDTDKQFPVLGFGARLPPAGHVSHEFFVNLKANPYCDRVAGVISAYRDCLRQIQLYGPTNFAPIIRHVTKFAREYQDGSHYFILLILTDGVITDMYDTKEAIVDASSLPLSIIIVGIGDADFSAMEELDSDNTLLKAPSGRRAQRDIVQFVPFNQFLSSSMQPLVGRLHLAREVLREIPDQFIGYMKSRNLVPKPPRYDLVNLPPDPEL